MSLCKDLISTVTNKSLLSRRLEILREGGGGRIAGNIGGLRGASGNWLCRLSAKVRSQTVWWVGGSCRNQDSPLGWDAINHLPLSPVISAWPAGLWHAPGAPIPTRPSLLWAPPPQSLVSAAGHRLEMIGNVRATSFVEGRCSDVADLHWYDLFCDY